MTNSVSSQSPPELISWLERKDDDFPYYREGINVIRGSGWWFVMLGVAVGFFALIYTQPIFPSGLAGFIPAILYSLIPLAVVAALTSVQAVGELFRPMRRIDWVLIVLFVVLNYVVTIAVATLVISLFDFSPNPAGDILASSSGSERVLFFAKSAVQLLGEELFTILPFLAVLYWLHTSRGVSRTLAVVLAALVVSVIFALVHLPTYQWRFAQALVGLVPVRIVLLLPYIITKNIWVSTGVHVLNDFAIFGLPLLVGAAEPA